MLLEELLFEYISKTTFDTIVKRVCAKHGITKNVKTTTMFNHDKGILDAYVEIQTESYYDDDVKKLVRSTTAKNQKAEVTGQLFSDIYDAVKKYGATSLSYRASTDPQKTWETTQVTVSPERIKSVDPLETIEHISKSVKIAIVFGSEDVQDVDSVYKEEAKRVIEEFSKMWKASGVSDNRWWAFDNVTSIIVFPRHLPKTVMSLSDLHDDPEVQKKLKAKQDELTGDPQERMLNVLHKEAVEIRERLKDFINKFDDLKATTLKLTTTTSHWEKDGQLVDNTRSVRYTPEIHRSLEKSTFKIQISKDIKKFDAQ